MAKTELGKIVTIPAEKIRKMHEETMKRLYEGKGPFSGTNVCECGGDVGYDVKRSDGAELGVCRKCGREYIDPRGHRLPSVYDSDVVINACA